MRPFFGAVGFTDFQTFPPYSYVFCCIPSKIANREQIQLLRGNIEMCHNSFHMKFEEYSINLLIILSAKLYIGLLL